MADIKKMHQQLKKIGNFLFGKGVELGRVAPADLTLLKQNARYFKKERFRQLVENVKADQRLSSMPLCYRQGDDLIVLSGNHRVKAAVQAGIAQILVMIITAELDRGKQISIQLSHNALVGDDDPAILADLWAQVEELQDRLYTGLSSDAMGDLEKIELVSFATPQVYTKSMTFAFTAPEKEKMEAVLGELSKLPGDVYLADVKQFDDFFAALQDIKKSENVKNASLAMLKLIDRINPQIKDNP